MIELDRTVTPIFVAGDAGRTEEKIFEQKVRKGTKLRERLTRTPVYEGAQLSRRE